jgi:hypothetical protein
MNSSVYSLVATSWGFAFNDGGGVFASTDDGLTWSRKATGSSYSNAICVLKNANKTVAMTDYNGTQVETVDGVGWTTGMAPYSYPNSLVGSVSSDKVDLTYYGYGNYSASFVSIYASFFRPEWLAQPLAMPIKFSQVVSDYRYPPVIVWTGSHFVFVNPKDRNIIRSTDGMSWSSIPKPYATMSAELVLDNGAEAPALVTPSAVPSPTFSVPSGSYPCSSAGVDGTYSVVLGVVGYVILCTVDDAVDLAAVDVSTLVVNDNIKSDGIGIGAYPSGTDFPIKANTTKTLRAIAIAIDGRKSSVSSVTITATQV